MHLDNEDKIAFITNKSVYCYKVMLVKLKNAEATYQKMMNKVFAEHIRRNFKVYVDDTLVKSKDL